jgi:hypothetical protein
MAFKSLATNSVIQCMDLLSDLKLGMYMDIIPKHVIIAQFYGTFVGSLIGTISCFLIMDNMKSLGSGAWQATKYSVFYNAGAIWGAIGPAKFFGPHSVYNPILYCFIIGAFLPVIPWIMNKYHRHRIWKSIYIPLLANFESPGKYFFKQAKIRILLSLF